MTHSHRPRYYQVAFLAFLLVGCPENEPPTETIVDGSPVVAITSPVSSEVLEVGVITAEATDDKGVVQVEIYDNNVKIGVFNVPPYSIVWDVESFPDSSIHLIYAKASDADGNVGTSPLRTFTTYRLTPTDLGAFAIADSIVELSWRDNSRRETGYEIEQSIRFDDFSLVKSVDANVATTLVGTGNEPPTDFRFRVRAMADTIASNYTNVAVVTFPAPLTVSRTSVVVVPGTSVTVTVSGGRTPYYISQQGEPLVATATWVDSTVSPAVITISAPTTATIGDNTTISVADADERSATIFVDIAAVGNVSYSDDIQPIWDGNCQNRGCHPGGGAPFSLDRFVSWSNLYYAPVSNMSCGAVYRVVPGIPDSSLLYLLVTGRTTCPRMPFSLDPGDTLSQIDQDKIRAWIEQGAENN